MLQREQSAKLSAFIELPVAIKTFVLSVFGWPFYTGFIVLPFSMYAWIDGIWSLVETFAVVCLIRIKIGLIY